MRVDVDTLKEHYPDDYQRHYERWAYNQWEFMGETWGDEMRELANEWLEGTGWDADDVSFSLSYSQGDGVALSAHFEYKNMSEEKLNELRERFPMCAEMLRREMLWVSSKVSMRGPRSHADWVTEYPDSNYLDISDVTLEGGIYDGLPLFTAAQLCEEEGEDNLANFLHQDLVDVENRLYQWMRDDADYQTSEEVFVEWARDFEETFEVEEAA